MNVYVFEDMYLALLYHRTTCLSPFRVLRKNHVPVKLERPGRVCTKNSANVRLQATH